MAKNRNVKDLERIQDALDNNHYALAHELGRRYIETFPADSEGKWLYGQSLFFLDKYIEAKAAFESALPDLSGEADSEAEAFSYLAMIHSEMKDASGAERLYEKAIDGDPTDAFNYVQLATLLQDLKRSKDAEKVALRGVEAQAAPVEDLYAFLGKLFRSQGEIIKSFEAFQQALGAEDDEDSETAIADLEAVAAVLGIELPGAGDDSDSAEEETGTEAQSIGDNLLDNRSDAHDEEEEHHLPGKMVVHIHREFFIEILEGRKKVEYREWTPYWSKRINKAGEPPFHLRVINGMLKNAPELTIVVERVLMDPWADQFELHLGEIIDVKNWDRGKQETDE